MTQLQLWPDGERIPDDQIARVFRRPPSVPESFARSALIVGSKGAGKTTLLRFHKETHQGLAMHLSLATELASLPKQAALGPLTLQSEAARELGLINKTAALLAVAITHRMLIKNNHVPLDLLRECVPPEYLGQIRRISRRNIGVIKSKVSRASFEDFDAIPSVRPLVTFVEEIGKICYKKYGPLLLLLDRADLVVPTALVPVLELLDQSPGFTALVATRPGHGGATLQRLDAASGPGDQYDVIHLGTRPRSAEWIEFVKMALGPQLGEKNFARIPTEISEGVLALARDSLRTGLEVFSRLVLKDKGGDHELLGEALADLRELQLNAVQSRVREYHPNFKRMLALIRQQAQGENGLMGPLIIDIEPESQSGLFDLPTELSLLVEAGLRSAGFCMREGAIWFPGLIPDSIEIPPLLAWDQRDRLWTAASAEEVHINYRKRDFFKSGGGPRSAPSLFVAYRIESSDSIEFQERLVERLGRHPKLHRCVVVTGRNPRVPVGVDWAPEIRRRIGSAKLVIGDATGLRIEVVFELGFAYGLGTPFLPVVQRLDEADLPYWIRQKQIGEFEKAEGLDEIVASIETHLIEPSQLRRPRPSPPVPSLAVWLRRPVWCERAFEQVRTKAQQEGVKFEFYDEGVGEEEVLKRAEIASLLFVVLDGTGWDSFSHFVCGAVAAKPESGYGGKLIRRRIVIIEPDQDPPKRWTAEGLSRCEEVVNVVKSRKAVDCMNEFCRDLRRWMTTDSGGEGA